MLLAKTVNRGGCGGLKVVKDSERLECLLQCRRGFTYVLPRSGPTSSSPSSSEPSSESSSDSLRSSSSPLLPTPFVKSCPPPAYDTGCTYCEPDMSLFNPNDLAKPINNTTIFHRKHLMISSGRSDSVTGTEDPSVSALLYPDNLYFPYIPLSETATFMSGFLMPTSDDQRLAAAKFKHQTNEFPLILICGHMARDARCGQIAPLIKEEFTRVLNKEGLLYDSKLNPSGVRVGICSHIGGHVYAGNVLYFNRDFNVWYGRVFPKHVQGIVEETIKGNRVIEPMYRGALTL